MRLLAARELQVALRLRVERAARQGAGEVIGARQLQHPFVHAVGDDQHEAHVAQHVEDQQRADVDGDHGGVQVDDAALVDLARVRPDAREVGQPHAREACQRHGAADAQGRAHEQAHRGPRGEQAHAGHHHEAACGIAGPHEQGGQHAPDEQGGQRDEPAHAHGMAIELLARRHRARAAHEDERIRHDGRHPQRGDVLQRVQGRRGAEQERAHGPQAKPRDRMAQPPLERQHDEPEHDAQGGRHREQRAAVDGHCGTSAAGFARLCMGTTSWQKF